ncbi:hypothetical protein LCGC14_1340610 [marine sediment metagenome]|uniref:Uncharacterized protein n=1 Tax=marine sediment metagenome TaxID=412755 RepID=A0A0F9KDP1_9ZZZZ
MARIRGIGTAQHARRRVIRPWNPLLIFGVDLELWLRSDLLVGFSGSDVLTWGDLSTKGRNFSTTAGSRPIINLTDANWAGKPSLGFDATPLWLDSDDAASVWKFLHDGTGGGALIVYRLNSTAAQVALMTANTSTDIGIQLWGRVSGAQTIRLPNGVGGFTFNNGIANAINTNYYGYFAYLEGRPVNEWTHDLLATSNQGNSSGAPVAANPTASLRIGARLDATSGTRGVILEIIAFSVYPSDQQFVQLKAYLDTRYSF